MHVSLILLAHNEAAVIGEEIRSFHEEVIARLPEAELVVAEDGSRDGTRERILEAAREIPVRLVGGSTERIGYRRAVLSALEGVDADWNFLCDSGLKHDPADFWKLWEAREHFDLVLGRRTGRQDQWHRRLLTILFNVVVRRFFPLKVRDSDSGMRLLSRPVADAIRASGLFFRNFSSTEVVARATAAGFRCGEVEVAYRQRVGESRGMPARRIPGAIFGAFADLIRLRRELRRR
jgi:glycosyltransferase involved in cell wall biosynthesis